MSNAPDVHRLEEVRAAISNLPRVQLAHLPTPLDRCDRLAAELGLSSLWVKRDDATGLALGGNKTRQLEFILGHAIDRGYDAVIQGAASQSNHARQLAAAGAKVGLEVHLTPWQDARSTPIQGNYLLTNMFGAHVHPIPAGTSSREAKAKLAERLKAEGRNPFVVGMGAEEALVLAAVAYVDALVEILDQLGTSESPDWIFTTSQGSTQAGLLAGVKVLGLSTRVVGINPVGPDHEAYTPPSAIHAMVERAARHLGFDIEIDVGDVENSTDYVGAGYGVPSDAGMAALHRLARMEGILLDPVYSSKGMSGMIDAVERGRVEPGERVVFVHTGGLPGAFAYADALVDSLEALS